MTGNQGTLSDSLLPLAVVSIQRGTINWIDPYLVRRDSGPLYSGVRFGLNDAAAQQAFLLQYNTQLQAVVATRQSSGLKANFAATDFFQALPSAGPFPLDAIDTGAFSQVFFPQQMDVRLSLIPSDELPALVEDSMSLPPIDLTLPADAYANLAVLALIPVPRSLFASLKSSLPDTPLNPTMPQVLANRSPIQLLKLFQGAVTFKPAPSTANSAWAIAIGSQKYGFYVRRRSEAIFVDFTTVVLSSSQNPSVFGQPVTFTAKITPPSATGTIQFNDGTTALGAPVAVSGGSASLTVSNLAGGARSITAVYGGDGVNEGSTSAVLTQMVSLPATVTLISSKSSVVLGQSVTFTATVSPGSATGTVQFNDGTAALGTQSLSGGKAVLTTSSLSVGTHSLTAVYSGDANDAGNMSPVLVQQIEKVPSTTTLIFPGSATVGQGVVFTATITPASATGAVQFNSRPPGGGTPVVALGTATVNGGKATLTVSTLAVGQHSITAVYSGDANNTTSTSAAQIENTLQAVSGVVLSGPPNEPTIGQSVTFTATVTPVTATGTVQFNDGTTALGAPVTLSGGKATLAVATLALGPHSITAVYSGDGNDAGSTSPALALTVIRVSSNVTVISQPTSSQVQQSVIFTATVTPSSATGNVQFLDGTTSLGAVPVTGGSAVLSVSTLVVGSHQITAVYSGDTNNTPSTSAVLTQKVTPVITSALVTAEPLSSTVGQSVTLTAQITPASATGTVQFMDGAAILGTPVALSGGKAVFAVASLSLGTHPITAVYSGDTINAPATSPAVSQNVGQVISSVLVKSSVTPSQFGQSVTFTATVTPAAATGTVQFKDGAANLGAPVSLINGKADLPATTLSVGLHTITAAYNGDANDTASTSPIFNQNVNPAGSSVILSNPNNPSTVGQAVTFTATVTPSSATGTVQFNDGTTILGTPTIAGGQATLTVSTLAVGSHSITAAYSGDPNDAASVSIVMAQKVNPVTSTVTVTSSPSTVTVGQAVAFTAIVTPASATGTVQFKDGTANLGTAAVPVSGGKAVLSGISLALGAHSIVAAYSGDGNDTASTSPIFLLNVNPTPSTIKLIPPTGPLTFGQAVTLTASVIPASATGSVQFKDGPTTVLGTAPVTNGQATLLASTLAVGAHSITAAYSGDPNDTASVSIPLPLNINQAPTTVVVTAVTNPSAAITLFTATVTPATATGTVQFTDNSANLGPGPVAVSAGKATLSIAVPTTLQQIAANYSGDANFLPSTSPIIRIGG